MSSELDLRQIQVVAGPDNTVFVQSVTADGKTHHFSGNTGDRTLPTLETVMNRMHVAGYEPTRDLSRIYESALNGGTKIFFRRTSERNPDNKVLENLMYNADDPRPPASPTSPNQERGRSPLVRF